MVDPGFPVGGGANPPGGTNIRFCQIFPKNFIKLQEFGSANDNTNQVGLRSGFCAVQLEIESFPVELELEIQTVRKLDEHLVKMFIEKML